MERRAEIIIHGRVQRAGYRDFIDEWAFNLDLKGNVRNLKDGTVKVICEGEEKNIQEFIKQINIVQYPIRVEKIDIKYSEPRGEFKVFEIIREEDIVEATYERMDAAAKYMREINKNLGSKIDALGESLGSKIDALGESLGSKIDALGESLGSKIDALGESLGSKIDAVGNKVDAVGNKVDALGESLGSKIDAVGNKVDAVGNKVDAVGNKVDALGESLGSKIDAVGNKVDSLGNKIEVVGSKVDSLGDKVDKLEENLGGRMDKLLEKQDTTILEIKGMRSDLKSYLDYRFAVLEAEIAKIKQKIGMS